MSTHLNCQHCGAAEPIRALIIDDNVAVAMTLAILGLGRAARKTAEKFNELPPLEIVIERVRDLDVSLLSLYGPTDSSVPLAPNHQDYTPNYRKNRRGKFKRSKK